MRYTPINKGLFVKTRAKLLKKVKPDSLVIIHSNDEVYRNGNQCYPFRQNSDLFYLSGFEQSKTILCFYKSNTEENHREIAFINKSNEHNEIWHGHKYNSEEAEKISGIKEIKWLDEFDTVFKDISGKAENLYFNTNENLKSAIYDSTVDGAFFRKVKEEYPDKKTEDIIPVLTELRLTKEPEEIELIKKGCDITDKAFRRVLKFVKPELMEYEIEAEITHEFISNGANGHAYPPIIASGKNACVLHYENNDCRCKSGDLLLMDFGAEYANYTSDLSRTVPVNGRFTKRQRECYEAVLRVFKHARSMMLPGKTIDDINKKVYKLIEAEMITLGLFTAEDVKNQQAEKPMYFRYFMHGTSHFIGLDVHDVGTKQHVLQEGMILSCEPGLYIKEENIGIRIENDILVTSKGHVDLMENIPVEADEIEKLMSDR